MKTKNLILLIVLSLFSSCSKDNEPKAPNVAPIFAQSNYEINVFENPTNFELLTLTATDSNNDQLTYSIVSQNISNAISINETTGVIYVENINFFNYEFTSEISATVKVSDGELEDTAQLLIYILDKAGPENNLIAYYPFEGNANDYSIGNHHGTILGNVSSTTNIFNKPNSAYEFNGGRIKIPTFAINETSNPNLTFSAWIHRSQNSTIDQPIFSKLADDGAGRLASNVDFSLKIDATSNVLKLIDKDVATVNLGGTIQQNTWHHLVMTLDNNNAEIKIYLDNNMVYGNTAVLTNWGSTYDLLIGGISNGTQQEDFFGKIDDVLLYNRVLTAQEVNDIYTSKY